MGFCLSQGISWSFLLIYKVVDGDVNESDDKSIIDVDHFDQSIGDNAWDDDSVCEHQLAPISPSLL